MARQPGTVARDARVNVSIRSIAATAAGRAQRDILALDGALYIVVTEPATFADEVLGTLTTGYALDNALAYELARTTGRDVALDRRLGDQRQQPESRRRARASRTCSKRTAARSRTRARSP